MKMIKLMTVTALTLGAVLGTVVESVEARGGRWSGSSTAEPETFFEFSLFTQTPRGQDIRDSKRGNPNLGLFKGAIKDFSFCLQSANPIFPNLGNGCDSSFDESFINGSFPVLNLKAERKTDSLLGEIISYSFIDPETKKQVFPDQMQVYIDPVSGETVELSPGEEFNLYFSFSFPAELISTIVADPVNSIEDIYTLFTLPREELDDNTDCDLKEKLVIECLLYDRSVTIANVSEPNTVNILLTFCIFGTGFALRHKFQTK